MKAKRYLTLGFLLLACSTMDLTAGLLRESSPQAPQNPQNPQKQTGKRPRIQTSASEKEIVFKPTGEKDTAAGSVSRKQTAKDAGKPSKAKAKAGTETRSKKGTSRYIAIKTNIAYDAAAIPNAAFEIQCNRHISVELPVMLSFWDISQKHAIRTVALQPEGRWWLKQPGNGHFFGVHAHIAWFNVKWDEDRYQSTGRPLLGAGISYGYKLPLTKHWGAEFTLGAGYANMKYNTYYNIENGAKIDTQSRNYWGITRLGLSLSYQF